MLEKIIIVLALFITVCICFLCLYYLNTSKVVHLEFEGRRRTFLVHVPGIADNTPRQLILMLHGYGDHPRLMELYSGMSRKADRDGTIVVYPYGINNTKYPKLSWNGGSCCAAALEENTNDVGFLSAVIDQVSTQYNVDQDHISIAGFSNGAIMAQRFVVESNTSIRSIALVASAVGGKRTIDNDYFTLPPHTKNTRVMLIHGELDTTIPMQGGLNAVQSATWESFDKAKEYWKPTEVHIVPNRGHVWFGSFLEILLEKKWPGTFSATDKIWEYFK